MVPSRRRPETGRRRVGQGHRHLLAPDESRRYRPRDRSHLIGRRGIGQEGSEGSGRLRVRYCAERVLLGVFAAKRKASRPSLVYCGDNESSKAVAAELIRDVRLEPVDAGPLRIARYTEPFTLLIAQLAYEGDKGPELAYRFERFGRKG